MPLQSQSVLQRTDTSTHTPVRWVLHGGHHMAHGYMYCTIFMCIWSLMFDVVDQSRVILKVPDETGCDYINASYINVSGNQCICVALDCVWLHTKYHSMFYCFSKYRATCKRVHTLPLKVCTHVLRYIQTCALLYIISMHSSVVAMHSHANTFTLDSHVCSICCEST